MDAAQGERRGGEESGDESEGDRMLVNVGEDERCRERDQKPADEPAGRDQEVEAGQIGCGRTEAGKRAVAVERGQGKDQKVEEAEHEDRMCQRIHDSEQDKGRGHEAREERLRDQLAARESMDVRAEVDRERHDPEERHRRHVGGEVSREREEEGARNRRQREDAEHGQRGRGLQGGGDRGGQRRAAAGRCQPQDGEQRSESKQGGAPGPRLEIQAEEGLEQEWIGNQGAGGARVRGRVEEVRIGGCLARTGPCQPRLNEWSQGRGRDEGDPERARQRPEEPQGGREAAGRISKDPRSADRRREGGCRPESAEDGKLPHGRYVADKKVRQCIPRQQRRLEEHHRGVPHRRRAAEDRQDAAYREGLNPEHEPRGGEDDEAVKPGRWRGAKHGRSLEGPTRRGDRAQLTTTYAASPSLPRLRLAVRTSFPAGFCATTYG